MIIRGTVADVETAINIAREVGGFSVVNLTVIPRWIPACSRDHRHDNDADRIRSEGPGDAHHRDFSVASAIKAADCAVKEADLDLSGCTLRWL